MKNPLHLIACVACTIFSITACENQRKAHHSGKPTPSKFTPSKSDSSSNSFATETTQSVLSKKEFDDPADGYFHAYLLMREAEKTTNQEKSIRNLQEALGYFRAVKQRYPDWKTEMDEARTRVTEDSLTRVSKIEQ